MRSLLYGPFRFGRCASAKLRFQAIEPALPETGNVIEPSLEFGKAGGIELIDAMLALDADADQTGLLENLEVLGDGGRADVELGRDLAGREVSTGQDFHDAPAGGFGEGGDVQHDLIMKYVLN
jgi:hypothetical protein